ncbi:PREDICTED: uncharacterized protein CXorf67-like [Hipposideros armiger]|uniref:Uncharacterized protein CXorf67-like n=1 Tax=Hipposideros armiger TaxID=186990 RepID=A0A8B7QL24_HIPAR|nr:PREDICTED: uncharacterized protein CXorf67-like [Hipposideros armiger]
MATQSCWEKELKQQEGEVPAGPENEVAAAHGNAQGTGNPDPSTWVPTISSDQSLSGGGTPRSGTAGDSTCAVATPGAILVIAEDPGSPSMDCVQATGRPEHRGSQSPLAELRRVGPGTAHVESGDARGQATRGTDEASGRPAQTRSPAKSREQKRPSGIEAAGALERSRHCLFLGAPAPEASVPLSPSSPMAQPSSHRRRPAPRASPCDRTSLPGPALRSQALLSAPGPALRSQAARQGPALRSRTTPPGPAVRRGPASRRRCAPAPGPAPLRDESGPGSAPRRRGTAPGPAMRRRHAPEPGSARRRSEPGTGPAPSSPGSAPVPAVRCRTSRPGHALRCAASEPAPASPMRASGTGPARSNHPSPPIPALRSRATPLSPALRSGGTTPGFVLRSCRIQRRSSPSSRPSIPGPGGEGPPSPGSALGRLVIPSSSGSPDPEVPSLPSQPCWHAVRMRASSPSPPGRYFPLPGRCDDSSSPSLSSTSSSSSCSSSSPSSSPTNISGQRSSSPKFCGLGSISTPSPASLRRAFQLEFDALSPVSPEVQAEVESIPSPPSPPVL